MIIKYVTKKLKTPCTSSPLILLNKEAAIYAVATSSSEEVKYGSATLTVKHHRKLGEFSFVIVSTYIEAKS